MSVINSLLSTTNGLLRKVAQILPQRSPVRVALSNGWTTMLSGIKTGVAIPMGSRSIQVLPRFRNLSPSYEAETFAVWLKLLRPGDVVWDIGANIGVYTILSGQIVGQEGAIDCWEPTPDSYESTCKHIELNGLAGFCKAHQAAVSSSDGGTMPFSIVGGKGTDPTNRLGSTQGTTIDIPIESMDGILGRSNRKPNYIKIDIEGAEVFALRGAEKVMTETRPTILIAVHPMFLPEFDCDAEEIAETISSHDYVTFNMNGQLCQPVEYSEYLLVPSERVPHVRRKLGWENITS